MGGWVVVGWVAAALLTTALLTKRPLLSECLPASQQCRPGKETEQHSSSFVSIACLLLGSNTAVAASSNSRSVRVASCLVRSLIRIPFGGQQCRFGPFCAASRQRALWVC